MKNVFEETILEQKLPNILSEIKTILETDKGEKFLMSLIQYIFYSTEIDAQKITETINSITKKGGKIAMTTAMKLIQKGRQEERKETIIKLYQKAKFTIKQIVDYLEIDKTQVEKTLKEKGIRK